jgi:hypothetical protein
MKEKPTIGSPYFGTFPFDCILKAMKGITIYFFIHNKKSCKLFQQIPVNILANYGKF